MQDEVIREGRGVKRISVNNLAENDPRRDLRGRLSAQSDEAHLKKLEAWSAGDPKSYRDLKAEPFAERKSRRQLRKGARLWMIMPRNLIDLLSKKAGRLYN